MKKSKPLFINRECTMKGCAIWEDYFIKEKYCEDCLRCGFNIYENERRKKIPLTMDNDTGFMRKVVPNKRKIIFYEE